MAGFKTTLQTYYRLTKPGIVYGNCLTTAGGFLFAARGQIAAGLLLVTLLAIALVMAAGCVYNNVLDQKLDAKMQRTKNRALVSGAVTNRVALIYASILALGGLGLLVTAVNNLTAGLGLFALFAYVVLYGFAKRRTAWGTLVGCISGALPPVGGYTAVTGRLDYTALLLFLILVAWQLSHFYAIALYRLADYKQAGLPVWPARHGIASTRRQIVLFIVVFGASCLGLTVFGGAGYSFLAIMLAVSGAWLFRTLRSWPGKTAAVWARGVFGDSLLVMLTLSVMLALGSTLA